MAYSQYFAGNFSHLTSQACMVDLNPPTFAGITTLVAQANGSLKATWAAATELVSPPIHYKRYIQLASEDVADLFNSNNHIISVHHLETYIFTDKNDDALLPGTSYRVGVRAIDAVGNESSNTQSLTAISTGVLTDSLATISQQLYAASLSLAASADAIGGGVEIEAETDPEVDVEADVDPEIDVETDC